MHGSSERIDLSGNKLRSCKPAEMALSNEVLTSQLQALAETVRGIGDVVLPRMNNATETLQVSFKDMDTRLEVGLNPLIEANVVDALTKAEKQFKNLEGEFADMKKQIQTLSDAASQQEGTNSTVHSRVERLAKL